MSTSKQLNEVLTVIEEIKALKDTKSNFYRDNESDYYHKILSLIEFFQMIKSETIEKNIELFRHNLHVLNDFKDLFWELYDEKEYDKPSAKKTNFYNTINTLLTFTTSFPKKIAPIKNSIESELEALKEQLLDIKEQSKNDYIEVQKAKKEFFDTKRAIEEDNRLYSSQKYWSDKKKSHQRRSWILSALFTIIVTLLVFWTTQNINTLKSLSIQESNTSKKIENILPKATSLKHLIIHIFSSLLIWLSRIILKIIFSNLHLKEEAYEKETMIVTYLALIKEGGGLNESDRSLILEAIFRPSTNGLIKDESSVTLLDVANIFKGKST